MALTYKTDDFYTEMNNLISSVQQPTPKNMTLVPNYAKPNLLNDLAPKTQGPMTVQTGDGGLMSVAEGTPLRSIKREASQVGPRKVETGITTDASANIPTIAVKTIGSGNASFDTWAKMRGLDYNDPENYEKYLERASAAKIGSAVLTGVGSLLDASSARTYRKDVEATASQYETQKKIIDTNIDRTESALMENLMKNMSDLDVMSAAKNVDLSSQAIAGDKAKGAMDLGKDIADMRTNGALQKAALDLEYAMNVRRAKQAEINSYVNAGLSIASSALSLL